MQNNTLINGPVGENNHNIKESADLSKVQQNGGTSTTAQPFGAIINQARPPLNRTDSRGSFPFRPPVPFPRPQQIRPTTQQQFITRSPSPGPGTRPPGQPFIQQPRANFRPLSPFPRQQVPNQRPPGIFQQRSVPSFGQQRPQLQEENQLQRSQTLDGTQITTTNVENNQQSITNEDFKPSIAAMKNRSFSLSCNTPEAADIAKIDNRRLSVSSVESVGEIRNGAEPSEKKQLDDLPSRPESRAGSKMNKILEDEDGRNSPINRPASALSQKSVEFSNNSHKEEISYERPQSRASDNHPIKEEKEVKIEDVKPDKKLLDLNCPPKAKSPAKSEGDNDSGVDESTQGNDQSSNGESRSPRKSTTKNRISSTTPTKNRSLSRGSKSPSLKSPDSTVTTPGSACEKKKIPMNKIQVGSAPSPNLKVVRSKIGSLENTSYKPGGGKVKIENKKIDFKNASSRIEAKNDKYIPKGGDKKIQQQKLQWTARSKIGSLDNATYKPKGGDKKIETIKLDFKEKAKSKVGSKDNIKHTPGGGDIKNEETRDDKKDIENKKIELNVTSKIGSLDNVKHKPGGGEKRIFDDKEYLKQKTSTLSSENQSLSGSQNSLPSQPEVKGPVADENLNQEH